MIYYILALIMGLAVALQAPINSALGRDLQSSPIIAALISFFIGTICLAILAYYNGLFHASLFKALTTQTWWKFLGGVLGAFFVFGTIFLSPKIGLTSMFLVVLFGQLIMSMLLDNMGAFSLSVRPISWEKVSGICVVFAGLLLFFSREIVK
ncbi:hypothetical protein CQA53_02625 [Helicobacter didelphidarum]|uniref:EamA-like transporter family protein n=1 Tax=Helicobacter didelphidarum TaxID=2040648 RepID=A0A3D8IN42_9HELI|nr:DMT family transporter [Helicobacter didelphidarum]RDU66688.1 hypothetical protein CQA53_02625 [Helicobacter didelphidarum]